MLPPGREVIIGATRDRQVGPVVMFGLGGIWVELLEDVAFRLAPLTPDEAIEMIQEVRGYSLLAGYREEAGVDIRALANAIVKLGELMVLAPEISEIDLNPVMSYPSGLIVADARILLSKGE